MKNLFIIFSVVALFSLTSCTKEYTCTCTTDIGGTVTTTTTTFEAKKKDAEASCDGLTTTVAGITTTCTLD